MFRFGIGKNAVGLEAPVGAAREGFAAPGAEQALVGEVGDKALARGGALRRPWCEAGLAHGFRHLADFFAAAPAVLDHALEEIGALFLPIDAGKGFLERGQHRVLDAIGPPPSSNGTLMRFGGTDVITAPST